MKKIAIFAGVIGIMLSVGLFGCSLSSELEYVTIDINPSVDMVLDKNENVQTVTAMNADGEVLLYNLQLEGKKLEEAVDEIIDEALELGYIDPDTEGTTVNVDGSSEKIRTRLHEHVNTAFMNKGIVASAVNNPNTELLEEAETLGVTPGFLRLVNRALEADDELIKEDALLLSTQELIKIIKNKDAEMKMVQNESKTEFFTEREALFELYRPQIEALEAEIDELETLGESTEAKLAELEALKTEFHDALTALRTAYQADGEAIRAQIQVRKQDRIQAHQQEVESFRSRMTQRRQERRQAIESFQNQFSESDDEEQTTVLTEAEATS
ncbi:MAG: hypothetical protein PHI01_02255 [Candidatus Izemoplasmatales bacterium]|nr:hypothetical protein [Candidatus Izemoplasmatales bacterium]